MVDCQILSNGLLRLIVQKSFFVMVTNFRILILNNLWYLKKVLQVVFWFGQHFHSNRIENTWNAMKS